MYLGHMSAAGCDRGAKLPVNVPGHPDRHQQNGTEPPPRQAGTHLSNSVRVEGQEGRDKKAAAVPHRYPQPRSHGSHSWPGFPEAHD